MPPIPYDVTVDDYKVHLHFREDELTKKELGRIRDSDEKMGFRIHIYSEEGEEVYRVSDLVGISLYRFRCPHLTLRTPKSYVSPWAVAMLGSGRLPEGADRYDALSWVSHQPFDAINHFEADVRRIASLDKFILRFEDMSIDGFSHAQARIKGNNISFDRDSFLRCRREGEFNVEMRLALPHELYHALEGSDEVAESGFCPEEHAEYFALRCRYEAREMMARYAHAIDTLKRNITTGQPFLFDPRSGSIEPTDASPLYFKPIIAAQVAQEVPSQASPEELAQMKAMHTALARFHGNDEAFEDYLHSAEYNAQFDRLMALHRERITSTPPCAPQRTG